MYCKVSISRLPDKIHRQNTIKTQVAKNGKRGCHAVCVTQRASWRRPEIPGNEAPPTDSTHPDEKFPHHPGGAGKVLPQSGGFQNVAEYEFP